MTNLSGEGKRGLRHWIPAFGRFLKQRFRRGAEYGLGFTLAFVLVVAALWLFLWIEDSIADQEDIYHLDFWIRGTIDRLVSPDITQWVIRITMLGNTSSIAAGVVGVGLFLLATRRWWSMFGLVFATGGGGLILLGLKLFFARARPVEQLIAVEGFAFPSGHAFGATVFYGYLIYLAWRWFRSPFWRFLVTVPLVLIILFVGTSRVYLNVHWLTDILGGFAAGFVWLVASIEIIKLVERYHVQRSRLGRPEDTAGTS